MTSEGPAIESVMTPVPYSVDAEEIYIIARGIMEKYKIRHLPVIKDGVVMGVVSERDINVTADLSDRFTDLSEVMVGDICTLRPYTVSPQESLINVLEAMADKKIGSAIITDEGKPVGIFTCTDACREYARAIKAANA